MFSLLDPPSRLAISMTQLVRLAKRAYEARSIGRPARYCYLPGELLDLFEMVAQAEMEELVLHTALAPFTPTAKLVSYDGMEIHEHDGLEIIVTETPL